MTVSAPGMRRVLPGLLIALATPAAAAAQSADPDTLQLETPRSASLDSGGSHTWLLSVPAGHYAVVDVRQRGVDVVVRVIDPNGDALREVDSPTGAAGTETARWIARIGGDWTIEVAPFQEGAGEYEIEWVEGREATGEDPARIARADSASVLLGQALAASREGSREGVERAIASWEERARLLSLLDERSEVGSAYNNAGSLHLALGRLDAALASFRRALEIAREVGDRGAEARNLANIANALDVLGRRDSALIYYRRGLSIAREAGDRGGEATILLNLGTVFQDLARPDSAVVYYGRALPLLREVGDRRTEMVALSNMGIARFQMGQPDSTLVYFKRALAVMRELGDRAGEGVALGNLGQLYSRLGRPDSALAYYRRALPIHRETGNRQGQTVTLDNMGQLFHLTGRPDSAVAYARRSLALARGVGDRPAEALILYNVATMHRQFPTPDHEGAAAYFDSAAAVRSGLEAAAGPDALRLRFAETGVELFEGWTLSLLAGGYTGEPDDAALAALAASERGRSQALLTLMRGTAEVEPGADLAAEARGLIEPLASTGTAGLVYVATLDTLLTWLIRPSGEVELFRRQLHRDTLAAWIAGLRADLGVDDARGLAAIAGRGAPPLEPLASEADEPEVEGPGALPAWPSAAATRLKVAILPPELLAGLPESGDLVVFPHGPLNLVPFGALPLPDGEPLGLRHGLRYAPSLASLGAGSSSSGPEGAASLVVGNPEMPIVEGPSGPVPLIPLPEAATEGRTVARRLGAELLTGATATETDVRRRLPGAAVVHLATHGYAYSTEDRARDSFVALAPDGGNDGLLTVGEILDELPRLGAELVVLSACETGLGDLKQAEGTVGFQRAFLAKGARNVLVSLWSVPDEATALLMETFYEHWRPGGAVGDGTVGMAEAFRRAQAEVRATPGFEHPLYWSGFQLVGPPR